MRVLLVSVVFGMMFSGVAYGHEADSKKLKELELRVEQKLVTLEMKMKNADSFAKYLLGCLVSKSNMSPKMGSARMKWAVSSCASQYKAK